MNLEGRVLPSALVGAGLIVLAAIVAVIVPGEPAGAQPQSLSPAAIARGPQNAGKVVGAPCSVSDGYVPERARLRTHSRPSVEGGPAFVAIYELDPSVVPLDRSRLPPGEAFCELPDRGNPRGYLTMNCSSDRDCSGATRCRLDRCRAPCESNGDCEPPTTCLPARSRSAVRYCACAECLGEKGEGENDDGEDASPDDGPIAPPVD